MAAPSDAVERDGISHHRKDEAGPEARKDDVAQGERSFCRWDRHKVAEAGSAFDREGCRPA